MSFQFDRQLKTIRFSTDKKIFEAKLNKLMFFILEGCQPKCETSEQIAVVKFYKYNILIAICELKLISDPALNKLKIDIPTYGSSISTIGELEPELIFRSNLDIRNSPTDTVDSDVSENGGLIMAKIRRLTTYSKHIQINLKLNYVEVDLTDLVFNKRQQIKFSDSIIIVGDNVLGVDYLLGIGEFIITYDRDLHIPIIMLKGTQIHVIDIFLMQLETMDFNLIFRYPIYCENLRKILKFEFPPKI